MKKKIFCLAIFVLLLIGIGGTVWGTTGLSAASSKWNSCKKGLTNDYYPGDCHDYTDSNGDKICDLSQPKPAAAAASTRTTPAVTTTAAVVKTTTTAAAAITNDSAASVDAVPSGKLAAAATTSADTSASTSEEAMTSRYSYYLAPILLISAFLYALTWVLAARKKITLATHRKIWNTALLVYALISCLLGILLVVRIETGFEIPLPFDMLFWHVEAGIAMSIIAVFHIIWHRKYFAKLFNGQHKTGAAQ